MPSTPHLLVVDDDPDALLLMLTILERAGHVVRAADSGELALASITRVQPELILLDLRMPGLGGLEICTRLKANPAWRDIPVIFISGTDDRDERIEGLRRGAVDFIVKPYDREELLARVNKHLDLERLRARLAEQSRTLQSIAQRLEAEVVERRRAQAGLEEQASRLALATQAGKIGIWEWDVIAGRIGIDATLLDIYGRGPEQSQLGYEEWIVILHPDDRERCLNDVRAAIEGHREYETEYRISRPDGEERHVRARGIVQRDPAGRAVRMVGVSWDTTNQMRDRERLLLFSRAVYQSPAGVVMTDTRGRIRYVNDTFVRLSGYAKEEVMGRNLRILATDSTNAAERKAIWETVERGEMWTGELQSRTKHGQTYWAATTIMPIKGDDGRVTHYLASTEDITARRVAEAERLSLQIQLTQAQKLESIGRLAAGIAHEINTPAQFVSDNISYVGKAMDDVERLLNAHGELVAALRVDGAVPAFAERILEPVQRIKQERLRREIPAALADARDGMTRITKIVRAMKSFSHPGGEKMSATDLNQTIESTLIVCRNEWKYVADVETELAPDLPAIPCLRGDFSQVILNLVVNAAHAIEDALKSTPGERGKITVRTRRAGEWTEVCISDTGTGIPEEVRPHIFEPFFTTKEVGKGTGQGLAMARSVIVERLKGTISFETESGSGTTFVIRLPVGADHT